MAILLVLLLLLSLFTLHSHFTNPLTPATTTQAEKELANTRKKLAITQQLLLAAEEQQARHLSKQEEYVRLRVEAFRRSKRWRAQSRCFARWRTHLHQRSLSAVAIRSLLRKKGNSEMRTALSTWRASTEGKRRVAKLRLQAVHIFNVVAHRELREAFTLWRRERERRRHFRRLLGGALQRR